MFESNPKVFLTTPSGTEVFDDTAALSNLLREEVVFCNTRHYSIDKDGKSDSNTIVLFVNCNDVFAWGCADAEDFTCADLPDLYRAVEKYGAWEGSTRWVCIKRQQQPQKPVADMLKKANAWMI